MARTPRKTPPAAPRRSQRERREATRTKLLDAAIATLIERGHARTTTSAVCARAGVSQGALFLHFASKHELVCAAAEHLFAALVRDYRAAFRAVAGDAGPDRVGAAVELLARLFEEPRLHAAFELYLAARTDADLAARLRPVADRHGANLRAEARALFPEEARALPDFDALLDTVVNALQGAALGGEALRDPARDRRLRAWLTDLVRGAFARAGAAETA